MEVVGETAGVSGLRSLRLRGYFWGGGVFGVFGVLGSPFCLCCLCLGWVEVNAAGAELATVFKLSCLGFQRTRVGRCQKHSSARGQCIPCGIGGCRAEHVGLGP